MDGYETARLIKSRGRSAGRAHHLPHRHQPGDRAPAAGLRGGGGRLPGQALRARGAAVEGGGVHGPPPAGPHHRGPEPAAGRAAGGARPGPGRPRPPRGRAPALQRRARPVRVDGRPRPAGTAARGERPARAAGRPPRRRPRPPTAASWSTGPGPGRRPWWPASTTCWPRPGAASTPCGWSGSTSTRSSAGSSTSSVPNWTRRRPRSGPTPSPRWWATSGCSAGSSPSCSTTRLRHGAAGNGAAVDPAVDVGLSRRGDDWVISVHDNGPGLDEDEVARLFATLRRRRRRGRRRAGRLPSHRRAPRGHHLGRVGARAGDQGVLHRARARPS